MIFMMFDLIFQFACFLFRFFISYVSSDILAIFFTRIKKEYTMSNVNTDVYPFVIFFYAQFASECIFKYYKILFTSFRARARENKTS